MKKLKAISNHEDMLGIGEVYRKDEVDARDKELADQLEKTLKQGQWIENSFKETCFYRKKIEDAARVLQGDGK